jgi:hypothetical protein
MRLLLLCLFPCCLLAAAPSHTARPARPPERPVPVISDDGKPLSDAEQMERLAREQPVEFVEECLRRYRRDVRKGYTLVMTKEERIDGQLQTPEEMEVAFREQPYSVSLKWTKGARRAERTVYVTGQNDDKMLVRPTPKWRLVARLAGRLDKDGVARVDVDGDDARQSGRFTIKEFGMYQGLARLFADWKAARDRDALHVEYLGEKVVPETGSRTCYVLRRTQFLKPERDGVTEQVLYIDKDNWLQVGSVSKGENGLVGAYFYRDITINPGFDPDPFGRP